MGEHHLNPVARANGVPQREVRVLDIGGGLGLLGIGIKPLLHTAEDGTVSLAVLLVATGGRVSTLVPIDTVAEVSLGELVRVPLSALQAMVEGGLAVKGQAQ